MSTFFHDTGKSLVFIDQIQNQKFTVTSPPTHCMTQNEEACLFGITFDWTS